MNLLGSVRGRNAGNLLPSLFVQEKKWRSSPSRQSCPAVIFPACWSSLPVRSCQRTARGNCSCECAQQFCSSPRHTFYTYTPNTSVTCTQEGLKAKITKLPKETHGRCHRAAQQSVVSWQRGALRTALEALHSVEAAENSMETAILLEWKLGTRDILSQMNQVQTNVPSNSVDLHANQRNSLLLGE